MFLCSKDTSLKKWFTEPGFSGNDSTAYIIQENHYYPFGMEFSGTSYMNGQPDNPFMYQSKENHSGQQWLNLNLYDFGARMFDGQTGRWNVPDPVNQGTSPYSAMGNNPVGNVDPDGCYFYFKPGLFLEHHKQLNAFRFPGSHMIQDSYNFLNNKNLWSSMEWYGQNWNDFLDYCYGRGKYTLQGPAYGTSLTWTSVDDVGGFLSTTSAAGTLISTVGGFLSIMGINSKDGVNSFAFIRCDPNDPNELAKADALAIAIDSDNELRQLYVMAGNPVLTVLCNNTNKQGLITNSEGSIVKDNKTAYALTLPLGGSHFKDESGIIHYRSEIYFAQSAFSPLLHLNHIIGHELVHAFHNFSGLSYQWHEIGYEYFIAMSEFYAYQYSLCKDPLNIEYQNMLSEFFFSIGNSINIP